LINATCKVLDQRPPDALALVDDAMKRFLLAHCLLTARFFPVWCRALRAALRRRSNFDQCCFSAAKDQPLAAAVFDGRDDKRGARAWDAALRAAGSFVFCDRKATQRALFEKRPVHIIVTHFFRTFLKLRLCPAPAVVQAPGGPRRLRYPRVAGFVLCDVSVNRVGSSVSGNVRD
jgi:hypothetical protein